MADTLRQVSISKTSSGSHSLQARGFATHAVPDICELTVALLGQGSKMNRRVPPKRRTLDTKTGKP